MSSKPGIFHKPEWFIKIEQNNLAFNQSVLADLRTIRENLLVVAIAGSLRTGKSWIMSHMSGCSSKDGFAVADGQTAVTSGIWIFCREHPVRKDCFIIFLDTEGLYDPMKEDSLNEDNRHFILAFLLSDVFIFNVMQKFDNNDLEKLGFITMIASQLQKKDAQKSFPEFLLLLRDIYQAKLDRKPVEPNLYLEHVLETPSDENDKMSAKCCIKEYCQKRSCFTLTQPVECDYLADLGEIDTPILREKFKEGYDKLQTHIFEETDVKRFTNHTPYTSFAFCEYAVALLDDIKDGVVPRLASVQERIAKEENDRLWDEVTESFKTSIRNKDKCHMYKTIDECFKALQMEGIRKIESQLIPLHEQLVKTTINTFTEFSEGEYLKVSADKCEKALMDLLYPLIYKDELNAYVPPGAAKEFEDDVQLVKDHYYKQKEILGPALENIWQSKVNDINLMRTELLLADLQHQLQITDEENKVERIRCQQMIADLHEKQRAQQALLEQERRAANEELRQRKEHLEQSMRQKENEFEKRMQSQQERKDADWKMTMKEMNDRHKKEIGEMKLHMQITQHALLEQERRDANEKQRQREKQQEQSMRQKEVIFEKRMLSQQEHRDAEWKISMKNMYDSHNKEMKEMKIEMQRLNDIQEQRKSGGCEIQ